MDSNNALTRHILFLNWRDTRNPEGGGSEVYVERVAAELASRGHRATILCASFPDGPDQEEIAERVTVLRRGARLTIYVRAASLYLSGALGFGPLSKRRLTRPDMIVDVGNGLPFMSPLYARKPVIALVHHVHREQWPVVMGRWGAKFGWWVESRLAPRIYRKCRYVTVSQATARELAELGVDAERTTIVHNGTPELSFAEVPRSETPQLVVLGRLVPHKRVEIALHALARLLPEFPDLRLAVAGQGWWEERLRELAVELGVADRVEFTGFVTQERKHELLSQAWVALTPSLKEGWGLTIVEAAACGTPSVAFAQAGGVTEAVRDGETGFLADDEENFQAMVHKLLSSAELRQSMGDEARRHAASFTWRHAGGAFEKLLA